MESMTRRTVLAGGAACLAAGPALAQTVPMMAQPHMIPVAQQNVVNSALPLRGQRIGRGECTDFVAAVLRAHGYPHDGGRYIWGAAIGAPQWGGVMQWYDRARWEHPQGAGRGYFETGTQHTLILLSHAGNGVWNVIEQNANGQRFVTLGSYDFSWRLVRGRVAFFQPGPWPMG